MKLIIDTEGYLYRAAAAAEYEAEWAPGDWTYLCRHGDARAFFQDAISDLADAVPDRDQTLLALGDRASFRYGLYPKYKANRKGRAKPAGFADLTEWVRHVADAHGWTVVTAADVEADDVCGILYDDGDIIASIDKDLLTIPGLHLRDGEIEEVTLHTANQNFYRQVLTGDSSDNYPGCPGMGPVKAEKALQHCETESEMWAAVVAAYKKAGLVERDALLQARLARILRYEDWNHELGVPRLWRPPVL